MNKDKTPERVRPKADMPHLCLSREKEYRVYGLLLGSYQLLNDRGVFDYYHPDLFDQTEF